MKIDPEAMRAAVVAHQERMNSPAWQTYPGERDGAWLDHFAAMQASMVATENSSPSGGTSSVVPPIHSRLTTESPHPSPLLEPELPRLPEPELSRDESADEVRHQLAELTQAVSVLVKNAQRRPIASDGFPHWLQTAADHPHQYDAREGRRTNVCARILPSTYARLKQAKARLGLRSIAGTWEYILRLGLAAAAR